MPECGYCFFHFDSTEPDCPSCGRASIAIEKARQRVIDAARLHRKRPSEATSELVVRAVQALEDEETP